MLPQQRSDPGHKIQLVEDHLLDLGVLENLQQKFKEVLIFGEPKHVEHVALAATCELHVAYGVLVRSLEVHADCVALLEKLQTQAKVSVRLIKIMYNVVSL